MEEDNKEYKIKVNKTFLEKVNSKNNNNKTKNYPFKKSILYNLKINPEIIINEFHQTSNNINTNINIKKDKLKNSEFISRNNNNIFDDNNNSINEPFNKEYFSYDYDYFKRNDRNQEINYNKTYTNFQNHEKDYEMRQNEKFSFNNRYSPFTSRINYYIGNTYSDKNRNQYIKNIKFNQLAKIKNKISDYIIPYMKENINIKKPNTERNKKFNKFNITNCITEIENNYIYSNRKKSMKKGINHISQDEIVMPNKEKIYDDKRNISINFSKIHNKTFSERFNTFMNKERNQRNYYPKKFKNNIEKTQTNLQESNEKYEKYKSHTYANWNVHKALNIKLMNYRIKIFKQFYIHFERYYKAYIKIYLYIFFKRLKYYTHNDISNLDFIGNKKSRNNRISENYKSFHDDNKDNYLLELYKFSTTNDYYNLNEPKNIFTEIKSSIFNDSETKNDNNFNLSLLELRKNIFNSTSRKDKDINCFSDRRRFINKNLFDSLAMSNISKINTETSRNQNLGNENYEKNELFRNLEELNKKGEKINRKKISKKEEYLLLSNLSKKNSKNNNIKKIRETKEYGQFSELRKKLNKFNKNNINNAKINIKINKNVKVNLEAKYNKTLQNFYPKKFKEEKNKNNNYKQENKIANSNAINLKIANNSNRKINNNIISYKKVKININKKFIPKDNSLKNIKNNKKNNISKNNKENIYIHKKKSDLIVIRPKLIYDIRTKDNRININIFYYNYSNKNKASFTKYDLLYKSKNFSMNLINNFSPIKRNLENRRKQILSSIKEEEVSIQNSKIMDECIVSFNLENISETNNQKESNILQFINIIESILIHIYKRMLFIKMKTINMVNKIEKILFNNDKKKNTNQIKNQGCSVYTKKLGIKVQKKIKNNENINQIEQKNV